MYISGHPADPYKTALKLMRAPDSSEIRRNIKEGLYKKNQTVRFLGVMDDVSVRYTSTGKKMAFLNLQDTCGSIEFTVFPEAYAKYEKKFIYGNLLYVFGRVSRNKFYNDTIAVENIFDEEEFLSIISQKKFCIKVLSNNKNTIFEAAEIMKKYPGSHEACFYLSDLKKYIKLKGDYKVSLDNNMLVRLNKIIKSDDIGLID